MQAKRNGQGIVARHARGCRSRSGGRCSCTPRWQAWVYLPREQKKLRKTFPTRAAADAWRTDAKVALRRGVLRAAAPTTVEEAWEAWERGAETGAVRRRDGRPFKPSTRRGYAAAMRDRILPAVG